MATMLLWVLTTTLGLLVGGFVLHFPGSYDSSGAELLAGIFGLILGFITGVAVGVVQWMGLRASRAAGSRLVLAMGAIIAITHGLDDWSPGGLPFPVISALAGAGAAAVSAWLLGERGIVPLAVSGLAWAGALVVAGWAGDRIGLPFEETPVGWSTDHAFDGLVVGLVWGTATALTGLPARVRGSL